MLQILVLERVDHRKNVHRYYVLSIEPTLFGDTGLRREWGRLGQHGGASWLELHEDVEAAKEALETWLGRKRERGYSVCGGLDPAERVALARAKRHKRCDTSGSSKADCQAHGTAFQQLL